MRRVWHVVSNRWYSAISAYALHMARSLALRGYDNFFTVLSDSPLHKKLLAENLPCDALDAFSPAVIKIFRERARALKVEFVIVYGGKEDFLSTFLGGIIPSKAIWRFRGQPSTSFFSSLTFLNTRRTIFPNKRLYEMASPALRKRAVVIPLSIDENQFSPRFGISYERPRLLIFGRLDPIKGHQVFLEIFATYLRDHASKSNGPRPMLQIAGNPENLRADDVALMVKNLHVENDVELILGKGLAASQLLGSATLGVVSSLGSEEICRVGEEFLLCGTPLLVSGAGALDELLFVGAGWSYKNMPISEAAALLAQCLRTLLVESPLDRLHRSTIARRRFGLARMAQRLEEVL